MLYHAARVPLKTVYFCVWQTSYKSESARLLCYIMSPKSWTRACVVGTEPLQNTAHFVLKSTHSTTTTTTTTKCPLRSSTPLPLLLPTSLIIPLAKWWGIKSDTPVATLPGTWRYRVSTGTGWPGANILWLGKLESMICSFYLSVEARTLVWADPSLRYTNMLLGRSASRQTTNNLLWSFCRSNHTSDL